MAYYSSPLTSSYAGYGYPNYGGYSVPSYGL